MSARSWRITHPDANVIERNHYPWFFPSAVQAFDPEWRAQTRAKMEEALMDPFVDDAAKVMLAMLDAIEMQYLTDAQLVTASLDELEAQNVYISAAGAKLRAYQRRVWAARITRQARIVFDKVRAMGASESVAKHRVRWDRLSRDSSDVDAEVPS